LFSWLFAEEGTIDVECWGLDDGNYDDPTLVEFSRNIDNIVLAFGLFELLEK